MKLNPAVKDIHDFKFEDFELVGLRSASGHQGADCGLSLTKQIATKQNSYADVKHFKAIAAMSLNRVIGADGKIPWHLPEDFKWFKKMTMGDVVVMGARRSRVLASRCRTART